MATASVTGVFELPCGARQSKEIGRVPLGSWSRLATRFDASKPATPVVLGSFPKAASQIPAAMMLGSPSQHPIGAVCGSAARTDMARGVMGNHRPYRDQNIDDPMPWAYAACMKTSR